MEKRKASFKNGDRVIVKQGVIDPDFRTDISGWTGTVNSVDETDDLGWLVEIYWDSRILSKMSRKHKRKCDRKNLNHEIMWLAENEIEML
jgi:hypothetical protein